MAAEANQTPYGSTHQGGTPWESARLQLRAQLTLRAVARWDIIGFSGEANEKIASNSDPLTRNLP